MCPKLIWSVKLIMEETVHQMNDVWNFDVEIILFYNIFSILCWFLFCQRFFVTFLSNRSNLFFQEMNVPIVCFLVCWKKCREKWFKIVSDYWEVICVNSESVKMRFCRVVELEEAEEQYSREWLVRVADVQSCDSLKICHYPTFFVHNFKRA